MTHAELNLAQGPAPGPAQHPLQPSSTAVPQESSPQDLATLRWLLDIALQPRESFDGYTRIDQVGPAALRYQLNHLQYALAMAQYTRTPAFTGYLAEAQRNLIDKMCDRRVWGYWFWQNLIGNLRWNSDPVAYHNVMYTGFLGTMIGLYQSLNDDSRYSREGALPLPRHFGKADYAYNYPRIAGAIRHNMEISHCTLYPCEPHLVYPMCNTFALNAVCMYDRLHGTGVSRDLVDRVRVAFDAHGFRRSDGRFLIGRGPLGIRFPASVGYDMVMGWWLNPLMPDLARASWEYVRNRRVALAGDTVTLRARGGDALDIGNYRRSPLFARAMLMACAREMGDEEIARLLDLEFEAHPKLVYAQPEAGNPLQRGARQLMGASVWCNAVYALARFSRHNAAHDVMNGAGTENARSGPLLTGAAYPEVLVARALNDGRGLDLVLQPGNGPCFTTLEFGRLQPGMRYRIRTDGDAAVPELLADREGQARLGIRLSGRLVLALRPDCAGD